MWRVLAPVRLMLKGLIMVNIGISLDSGTCHALAERAEENGFGDVTLRQAIEIYLDTTASAIAHESQGEEL